MAELTKEQNKEILDIWDGIKTGVAKSHHFKTRMIKLYNEIHRTNYKYGTNCSSCLGSMYSYFKSKIEDIKPKKKKNVKK